MSYAPPAGGDSGSGESDAVLTGAATQDVLYGYGGDDQRRGGDGFDRLVGGAHGNTEATCSWAAVATMRASRQAAERVHKRRAARFIP